MKHLTLALAFAFIASSGITQAASHEHDMSQHQMVMQPATQQGTGIIKALNAKSNKIQISHEPIAELGWPSMTMWFVLQNPMPADIKIGDAVQFEMQENDKKQWVIVKIARK
ncbi:MAG: copper-binding protein [Sideroxydans sp.]|nr:copper-binding protein [Sideroxydans sp.]